MLLQETRRPIFRRAHLSVTARAAAILWLAALYTATAQAGLSIAAVSGFATLVWAPTGIAVTAIILTGGWLAPGIFIGAFLANVAVGAPVLAALQIGAGNTLEALLVGLALRQLRFHPALGDVRSVVWFLVLAVPATAVSATIGVESLQWSGALRASLNITWSAWWIGDLAGAAVVAPLLLAFIAGPPSRIERAAELAVLVVVTFALGGLVFVSANRFVPTYALFVPVAWAALRFGIRTTTTVTFLINAIAVAATLLGRGPFAGAATAMNLLRAQVFMLTAAATGLVLAAAQTERATAVRRREELLATVSHDLRNPLSSIALGASRLRRHVAGEDAERADRIVRAAQRMSLLVGDLLDRSATENRGLALHLGSHDVEALAREVIFLVEPIAAQREVTLDVSISPDARVWCDRQRIQQVLLNLIGNAIKFTRVGTVVRVEAKIVDDSIRFAVTDEGPGVSEADHRRIFEPWRTTSGVGYGLGLAISRAILERHGSQISIDSVPDQGATFAFVLPALAGVD
jgi:signal transduction histidine kinase